MRTALIIAVVALGGEAKVVFGPTEPRIAKDKFKAAISDKEAQEGLAEIQMWTSDEGIIARKRFAPITHTAPTAAGEVVASNPAAEAAPSPAGEGAVGGDAEDDAPRIVAPPAKARK